MTRSYSYFQRLRGQRKGLKPQSPRPRQPAAIVRFDHLSEFERSKDPATATSAIGPAAEF